MRNIIRGFFLALGIISLAIAQPVYTPPPGIVTITGGTIDNTVIGGTTPAAGSFTNLNTGASGSYPSWSTSSPMFNVPASTLTDTTGSGTIALRGAETINNCTFAASSSETLSQVTCLYVGSPVAGANTSLGSPYSIYAAGGEFVVGALNALKLTVNATSTVPGGPGLYSLVSGNLDFGANGNYAGNIDANQNWRIGGAGTPTISSGACGTGANGTIAANGNNQAFEVLIGSAATTTCTITFANSGFVTAPREATFSPSNAAAAATGTTMAYVSTLSTTTLVLTGAALANTTYYVHVQ